MKHSLLAIWGIWVLSTHVACVYNDEETLYPAENCDTTVTTYLAVIAPIIEQHCFDCHDAVAAVSGIPLSSYDNLKVMVDGQRIIGALRRQVGYSPMPKDRPPIPECDILKIEQWIAEGAQNN
jgi:hypothetical protein